MSGTSRSIDLEFQPGPASAPAGERREQRQDVALLQRLLQRGVSAIDDADVLEARGDLEGLGDVSNRRVLRDVEDGAITGGRAGQVGGEGGEQRDTHLHRKPPWPSSRFAATTFRRSPGLICAVSCRSFQRTRLATEMP